MLLLVLLLLLQHDFDAVVVCNGHFTEPRLPLVKGSETYPGKQMHAHNYRHPADFKDQVRRRLRHSLGSFASDTWSSRSLTVSPVSQIVLVVGGSYSGEDISREVASVAKEVLLSSRSWSSEALVGTGAQPFGDRDNISRCGSLLLCWQRLRC